MFILYNKKMSSSSRSNNTHAKSQSPPPIRNRIKKSPNTNNNSPSSSSSSSKPTTNTTNDPRHDAITTQSLSKAWKSYSLWLKIKMILHMVLVIIFAAIPHTICTKLGIWKSQDDDWIPIEHGRLYYLKYKMDTHFTFAVAIRNPSTGALYIRSPPPLTPDLIEKTKYLGIVAAIDVTIAHDKFSNEWKEAFPSCRVLSGSQDRDEISNRVPVDENVEDNLVWLKNEFGIRQVIPTTKYTDFYDSFLIIDSDNMVKTNGTGSTDKIVIMPCGFQHAPFSFTNPQSWVFLVMSRRPFGIAVPFAFIFCTDLLQASTTLKEVAKVPNIKKLVFQHGSNPVFQSDDDDDVNGALVQCSNEVLTRRNFFFEFWA
jgi:hypothetical protein